MVAHHLGLDFSLLKILPLSTPTTSGRTMSCRRVLNHLGLLCEGSLLLGLGQVSRQGVVLPPRTSVQPLPLLGAVQLHQLLGDKPGSRPRPVAWWGPLRKAHLFFCSTPAISSGLGKAQPPLSADNNQIIVYLPCFSLFCISLYG